MFGHTSAGFALVTMSFCAFVFVFAVCSAAVVLFRIPRVVALV